MSDRPQVFQVILKSIQLDPKWGEALEKVAGLLNGDQTSIGPADVGLPGGIHFEGRREDDHFFLEWSPPIEADVFGPIDPDLLRARVYRDRILIDLRLTSIEIRF